MPKRHVFKYVAPRDYLHLELLQDGIWTMLMNGQTTKIRTAGGRLLVTGGAMGFVGNTVYVRAE